MGDKLKSFLLEDCMDAIIDYRGKTPKKTSSGVPLVTAKIVKNGQILPVKEYIAEEDYDGWMRRGLPEKGDVIITTEAPLGEVAQLDGRKVALAQRIITLRGKKGILDNDYLKFLMQCTFVQDQLKSRSTGTTVLGIKQSELRKIEFRLPPVSEQKNIAMVLKSIENKIELSRQMNETLESIARALFNSWFINFDPVLSKMTRCEPEGSFPQIAALFPNRLIGSSLGEIPEGWSIAKLGEVADLCYGKALKADNRSDGEIPVYGSNGQVGWHNEALVRGPGVIVGRKGNPGIVKFVISDFFPIDTTFYVQLKENFPSMIYIWLLLDTLNLPLLSADSAVPGLNRNAIINCKIILPSYKLVSYFDEICQSLIYKHATNLRTNETLSQLRDLLLPKLISGDIRVKEIEKVYWEKGV